jgi:hypothetical protein
MNNYGLIMEELGMKEFFDEFIFNYVKYLLLAMSKDNHEIDDYHAFVVEYNMDGDQSLDFHVDDSEVTINICLGDIFEGISNFNSGCNVYFAGFADKEETWDDYDEYVNEKYKAILHDGDHRHGATKLISGHRLNLIIWLRSNEIRKNKQK